MAFNSAFERDWKEFSVNKSLRDLPDILGYDLFLKKTHKEYGKYNPLQALVYLFIALLIIFTTFTGAALYKRKCIRIHQRSGEFQMGKYNARR